MKIFAHAKINLTLGVLGKRPDGYHEVEMVMQSIALHDTLQIRKQAAGISLTVAGADLPGDGNNLVFRAASLLQAKTGNKSGVHIHLAKRIPVAAGLGGGSADAAAALRALNMFWRLGLSPAELMDLGAALGSDVPFCLLGGTAIARGRGELLTPLSARPKFGLVLVKPAARVSTARVYGAYGAFSGSFQKPRPDCAAMAAALAQGDPDAVARCLANDLEPVTAAMHPEVRRIKEKLLAAGATGALMSGSGPTVFGLTGDVDSARLVAARYRRAPGELVFVSQMIHPSGFRPDLREPVERG
ncbi:MAG: 4-(cytidine 5'-diphospho)-2-C-methyl-D-erythritol kinase [Firmicutes bacterium]|nr:4-(cytidine 5'-diphospho)-2-C-methyl-D-erythritol kinase [Bacillota bacterium]